jgi:hypothetical protein
MPNWCENKATIFHKDESKLQELLAAYKGDGLFSHFLPTPTDANGELIADTKHPDYWYNWNANNWGTKWDVSEEHDGNNTSSRDEDSVSLYFMTAWGPPAAFYQHLETLGYRVKASFFEPGMCFAGYWEDGIEQTYTYSGKSDIAGLPHHLVEFYGIMEYFEETV